MLDDYTPPPVSATNITNAIWCGSSTGSANARTISVPGSPVRQSGLMLLFRSHATTSGADPTLDIGDGGGAIGIYSNNLLPGGHLQAGALQTGGIYLVAYESGGWWQLINASLTPGDMPVSPYLEAQKTSGQTLSGTNPTLTYDTPTHNDCFTVSSSVFTATVAGWYHVFANLYAATSAYAGIQAWVNGSLYPGGQSSYVQAQYVPFISCLVYLGVGDTLTLKCDYSAGFEINTSVAGLRDLRVVWRGK